MCWKKLISFQNTKWLPCMQSFKENGKILLKSSLTTLLILYSAYIVRGANILDILPLCSFIIYNLLLLLHILLSCILRFQRIYRYQEIALSNRHGTSSGTNLQSRKILIETGGRRWSRVRRIPFRFALLLVVQKKKMHQILLNVSLFRV